MNALPTRSGSSPGSESPPRSRRWLGGALAATLVATAWFAWQDDGSEVIAPAARARSTDGRAVRIASARPVSRIGLSPWPEPIGARRQAPAMPVDATAWNAPAPPPEAPAASIPRRVAPAASAARTPPAFAYALIGSLDDGQPRALLSGPLRSLAVKAGDIVDDDWRIDAVRADGVTLTWLPGNSRQQLGFKSS